MTDFDHNFRKTSPSSVEELASIVKIICDQCRFVEKNKNPAEYIDGGDEKPGFHPGRIVRKLVNDIVNNKARRETRSKARFSINSIGILYGIFAAIGE